MTTQEGLMMKKSGILLLILLAWSGGSVVVTDHGAAPVAPPADTFYKFNPSTDVQILETKEGDVQVSRPVGLEFDATAPQGAENLIEYTLKPEGKLMLYPRISGSSAKRTDVYEGIDGKIIIDSKTGDVVEADFKATKDMDVVLGNTRAHVPAGSTVLLLNKGAEIVIRPPSESKIKRPTLADQQKGGKEALYLPPQGGTIELPEGHILSEGYLAFVPIKESSVATIRDYAKINGWRIDPPEGKSVTFSIAADPFNTRFPEDLGDVHISPTRLGVGQVPVTVSFNPLLLQLPPSPKLQIGSRGPEVTAVQEFLISQGYKIKADGVFEGETQRVLEQWQMDIYKKTGTCLGTIIDEDNNCDPDGVFGWKSLGEALRVAPDTVVIKSKGDILMIEQGKDGINMKFEGRAPVEFTVGGETYQILIVKDYFKGVPLPSRGYFHAGDKNSGVLRIKEFLQGQGLPTPELPESEEEAVEGVDDDFFDATTEEQLKRWKLTIYQRTGTCLGNSYLEGCEPDGKFGQAELDAIKSERGNLYKILRQVATGTDQPSKTKVVVRVGNQPEVVLNEGQIESKGYKSSPTVLERIKNVFRAWMEGMNNLSKKLFGAPSQPPAREAPPARPAPTPPPVSFPPGT